MYENHEQNLLHVMQLKEVKDNHGECRCEEKKTADRTCSLHQNKEKQRRGRQNNVFLGKGVKKVSKQGFVDF